MFNLQGAELFAPTLFEILLGLLVSLVCSFVISVVYRFTYHGPGYANGFIVSLIVLSLITALVIMVIGNNLARAFGLVGALSIIRFRTAIKDTIDIVYLFFGLAIGMAAGVGYFTLAVSGTLFISTVLLIASKAHISIFRGEQFLLQLHVADEGMTPVRSIMDGYCSSYDLINLKGASGPSPTEFSYYVSFRKSRDHLRFMAEMKAVESVRYINLFRDEEHI